MVEIDCPLKCHRQLKAIIENNILKKPHFTVLEVRGSRMTHPREGPCQINVHYINHLDPNIKYEEQMKILHYLKPNNCTSYNMGIVSVWSRSATNTGPHNLVNFFMDCNHTNSEEEWQGQLIGRSEMIHNY